MKGMRRKEGCIDRDNSSLRESERERGNKKRESLELG